MSGEGGGGTDCEALPEVHSCGGDESADAMAQAAFRVSGFPKNRVLGMAGVLDSARMSAFVRWSAR